MLLLKSFIANMQKAEVGFNLNLNALLCLFVTSPFSSDHFKGQLQRKIYSYVFIAYKSLVSHAECTTTIVIILSCVVLAS